MRLLKTYFMVMVSDMPRAVAFYREVFGLEVRFESPDWSELFVGEVTLALHGGGTRGGATGLGFEVDDLDGACLAVAEAGGRIVKRPSNRPGEPIRLAEAADTEGNHFALAEPVS